MAFNPFATVDDYPGMLNKISTFTFVGSTLGIWLLRAEFTTLDALLAPLSVPIPLQSGLSVPFGTFLPAFVIAFLSRVFKFHDRLSDLFLIRHRFDISAILFPLAIACGAHLTAAQIRQIKNKREDLMYRVFYKYASSTPGKAVIDRHYITMALDQWCWYWIVLELSAVAFLMAVAFFVAGKHLLTCLFLTGVLGSAGLLQLMRNLCVDYALQQVEEIVAAPDRQLAIAEEFRAL